MKTTETYQIDWSKYLSEKRWREENVLDPKKDLRNPFEVDFGKVIFCPALRRMHDKTQVMPLSSGDCVSTRLTHSLHVMNVAESLACNYTRSKNFLELYKGKEQQGNEVAQHIRAILKAASLLHDIGNPPFGHFGEVAIRDYFKKLFETKMVENSQIILDDSEKLDFTEFDGNAQGLRIITKLQYLGTIDGLNLTYGTLGAYMKYPNEGKKEDEKEYIGNHKHGVFKTEQVLFHKIVENCNMSNADGTIKRHPLAFLVEAADTICYGTMDVEDGLYQNWYNVPDLLKDINDFIYKNAAKPQKICDIIGFNYDNESDKKEDPRAIHLKLREHLITYLVDLCIRNFNDNIEKIDKGEYGKRGEELVYDDPNCVARALKDFTQRKILSNRNVLKFEITGNSVITGLLDILIKYFFHKEKSYHSRLNGIISDSRMAVVMKENLAIEYPESKVISSDETNSFDVGRLNQYAKFRMIVDFVSSMTDKYSVELYQTLSGNSL